MTATPPAPELATLPLRAEFAGIAPYGAPQLDVPYRLNVNENPYPPGAEVVQSIAAAVSAAAAGLNRYPDRDFSALRAQLAGYLAVESGVRVASEQIWAANASNEVLLHVMQAFGGPGRAALSFGPTYSMYPEYARDTFTRWVLGRRRADFAIDLDHARELIECERPAVILLASPNNPTGTAMPLADIEAICRKAATVTVEGGTGNPVVVVDEAYGEFRRTGTASALTLLNSYPNLAVTRTMSKAFALAGARVGYLAASVPFIDALQVVRLPYHLSAVTQAVASAALSHADTLLAQVNQLREERDALVEWLRARRLPDGTAVRAADSDANFVLFGTFEDRHAVWQGLLDRGVLIRETGPDGWLRVSVGTPAETRAFKEALVEVAGL